MSTPRTKIEIVDNSGEDNYLIRSNEIRINGEAVCVEKDSLLIDYEDGEIVKVHLTLLPDVISFKRTNKEGDTTYADTARAPFDPDLFTSNPISPTLTNEQWEDTKKERLDEGRRRAKRDADLGKPEPTLTRKMWEDIKNASVDWRDPASRHAHLNDLADMEKIMTVVEDAKAGKKVVLCGSHVATRNVFDTVASVVAENAAKIYRTNGNEQIFMLSGGYVWVANSPDRLRGSIADTVWLVDAPRTEVRMVDWVNNILSTVATSQSRTIIYPTA